MNNNYTRKRCKICSKLIIQTPEWRFTVFVVDFEHILYLFLVFLLLTLNKLVFAGSHPTNLQTLKLFTAATINNVKTRPSKAKFLIWKNFPHHPLYHIPKLQKEFFAAQKLLRVLELLRVLSVGVLFMVLGDRGFFESLVIGSSKAFLLKTDVLLDIIFSKRRSHLTISLTCFNKF